MLNLIRAEWLKLTRRPLTWVLLLVFLLLLALQSLGQFVFAVLLPIASPVQLAEFQRRVVFPGVLGAVFGHINGLGGVFAIILTAGAMGSEYSWGTLRTHFARRPERTQYLLAKLVTLLLLLLLGMLITLVTGVLLGVGLGAVGARTGGLPQGTGSLNGAALAAVPLALLRALYVLLPYVLLTLACTVVGRSLLFGVAGGLLYLVFEAGFGALATFATLGGIWRAIYNLVIGQNINTLILQNSHAFGLQPELLTSSLDPAQLPAPLHAVVVIGLYSALFLATALRSLARRDIGGPS